MEIPTGITLGQALKSASIARTGGEAKILIQAGEVVVNGEGETRRGRTLQREGVIEVGNERLEVR